MADDTGAALHPRVSVNSLCFGAAEAGDQVGHWRALGARRIGLVSGQLLDDDAGVLYDFVASDGVVVDTIAHVFTGTLTPERADWHVPRARLSRLIEMAQGIGARSIYMLTGGRGEMDWERAASVFCEAVAPCVREARDAGVALGLECALPLLAHVHFAHSLRDAVALARLAGIGVCIDVFGCWTEAGLYALLADAAPLCMVMQVSDYVPGDKALPARAVPGDGAVPLRRMIGQLLSGGYKGGFDLELLGPRIEAEGHLAATRRAASALGDILRDLGA